jgi:CRISPR-associated protein Cas1
MSVFHGKTRAGGLVFDLADSFKDALVLPLAFSLVAQKRTEDPEQVFRAKLIEAFDDHKILAEAIKSVEAMLSAGESGRRTKD